MPGNKLQGGEMSGYQADAFHVCRRVSAGHQWPCPSLEMTDRENKTNTNSEHVHIQGDTEACSNADSIKL